MEPMTVEQFIDLLRKESKCPDIAFEAQIDGELVELRLMSFENGIGGSRTVLQFDEA